jgi:hypothetical protein
MQPLKIYLAGGLRSNWQERFIEQFEDQSNFIFFNPREHRLDEANEYTLWDLYHVSKADIIFAYMEKDNPSGYGLTLEIGYGKALDKLIVLVDERSKRDEVFKEKFKIVRHSASICFSDLKKGITFIKSFQNGIIPKYNTATVYTLDANNF